MTHRDALPPALPPARSLPRALDLALTLGLTLAATTSCAPEKLPAHEARTWTVRHEEPRDHATIGAALAAAAPGDIVRIGPGVWEERVVVDKPLTLIGDGATETVIVANVPPGMFTEAEQAALQEQLARATSDEARATMLDESLVSKAVVFVDAGSVSLQALGVRLEGRGDAGSIQRGAAVIVRGDGARIRDCAIVGSPASGLAVEGGDVVIEGTLVAAVEATGIAIAQGHGRVEIRDCDVRDAIHRGITISRDDALVEGCRISGSSWHGIRYDGVGPTIRNNVISGNKRSGIYASGRTSAQVTGNLFLENGFNGLSAWFENRDAIVRNTFAYNGRTALEVLGGSQPVLLGNVFAWSPTGVLLGNIGGDSSEQRPGTLSDGTLDLAGNVFFRCGIDAVWATAQGPQELTAAERGYQVLDPGFEAPQARDFSLPEGSEGRRCNVGAMDLPALQGPWPRRAPETVAGKAQPALPADAPAPPLAPSQSPVALSAPWVEAASQTDDPAARAQAVREVRAAIDSDDPVQDHAGLLAIARLSEAGIDWSAQGPRIRELCASLTGEAMRRAFYALRVADPDARDIQLVLSRMRDGQRAPEMSHLLMVFSDGDVSGDVGEEALQLLATRDADDLREAMRGLWGAHVDEAVEARLLEISRTRSEQDCIYFGLSTLQDKSVAVIERLFEAARNPDPEVFSRALWGLSHGVPDDRTPEVVAGAKQLLRESFVPEQRQVAVHEDARRLLEVYGSR